MGSCGRLLVLSLLLHSVAIAAQSARTPDSDKDGIDDSVEQSLLTQFSPHFYVDQHDCAGLPAVFQAGLFQPAPQAEDGTVYGQVFPVKIAGATEPMVEIHFYDLWDRDCGAHGHHLDTEHVAVLVKASSNDLSKAKWKAIYWYAAAHENTVCDVSQLARASALGAEEDGAKVWLSPGKHAAYLAKSLCNHGCGADNCEAMRLMRTSRIINLGEPGHPMNGSDFIASNAWPLEQKMSHTDFPPEPIARLNALPHDDIAWFNAGRHPAQGVIAVSYTTGEAIAGSGENTDAALALASGKTGNALGKSYRNTKHALGTTARDVGKALGVKNAKTPNSTAPQ
ncbi:MAG TPA: hypothetical protein VHW46_03705 [Terracidiphilus sp.]|nr:hypothetical protein [Terracidiphilus sp.]